MGLKNHSKSGNTAGAGRARDGTVGGGTTQTRGGSDMSTLRVPRALSSLIAAGEMGLLVALAPGQVNAQVAQPGSKAAARPVPAAGAKAKAKAEEIEVEDMVATARHGAELI